MHFYVLRRLWGSIFYAFLHAPAPLGQHLPYIFTCSGASGDFGSKNIKKTRSAAEGVRGDGGQGAFCMHFYVLFAT